MHILWQIIAIFFKWTWRSISFLRDFFSNIILIIFIIICINIYLQIKKSHHNTHLLSHYYGALKINIIGTIVDKTSVHNNFNKLSRQILKTNHDKLYENSLIDIVNAIRQAKNDNSITGIVLDLNNFISADQPSLSYLGKALNEFKKSGKPIFSIGDNYSQAQYYLASFADIIYLLPYGNVDINGFSTYNLYYKNLLDKLQITSNIFRIGSYKSAVEPFLRSSMSLEAREVNNRWINKLWNSYVNTISKNRNIPLDSVFPNTNNLIENLKKLDGNNAKYAKKMKLIDYININSNITFFLNKIFGFNKEKKEFNNINLYDYLHNLQYINDNHIKKNKSIKNHISLIIVNGTIVDGEGTSDSVGSNNIVKQINIARLDSTIKAIVLRINSPGGSVTASEKIREELLAVRNDRKPIVVSMSGTAASGGYWISTPANYIIASPNTLTGSIGIFGIFHTLEKFLNEIGINSDGISVSPLAENFSTKELKSELKQLIQLNIENGYDNFLKLVSKYRHKSLKEVEKIAQGIVWSGKDAKINGLVDALGDLDDAINKAAQLANLKSYQLNIWNEEPSILENFINHMILSTNLFSIKNNLNSNNIFSQSNKLNFLFNVINKQLFIINNFKDPKNEYVFCFNCYNYIN